MVDELEQAQEIIQVKTELHSLAKSFYSFVDEFKTYRDRSEPKPISIAQMLGGVVAILTILTIMFGSVIYVANSSNAPLLTQMAQITQVMTNIQNNTMQNASQGQLLNKELSGVSKSVKSNEETLRWIIFTENLPKQITHIEEKMRSLEENFKQHSHQKGDTKW